MSKMKFGAFALSLLMIVSSCDWSNVQKGLAAGGGLGAVLGGVTGRLVGYLIGKKMDKAKAAAAAVNNAQVQTITDANDLEALKVTFDSGILFATGKSELSSSAKSSLDKFATTVLIPNSDMDVVIKGHTDNTGFKGVTSQEENDKKNLQLSYNRAGAVSNYLLEKGVQAKQIRAVDGCGPFEPVADNSTTYGKQQNRRVEVYLYASEAMIKAAEAGTLQ